MLILVVAIAVLGGLQLFLSRTRLGREMRATAQDPDTAQLVGINARDVYARATAIAVATAALAGLFLAIRSIFEPSSGPTQLIFAFEAVVIGGFGSLWGTLLGGIVLGVAQAIGAQINPQYSILAGHLVFLAVLASAAAWHLCLARGGAGMTERRPPPNASATALSRPALDAGCRTPRSPVAVVLDRPARWPSCRSRSSDRIITPAADLAADPGDPRRDVECPGRVRRPGLGRPAGIHRPRRLRHHLSDAAGVAPYVAMVLAALGAGVDRAADLAARASPARRPVRDRHLGGGRGLRAARRPRPVAGRRHGHLAHRAQRLQPAIAARPTPTG